MEHSACEEKRQRQKQRQGFVQNTSSKMLEIEVQITHPACVLFSCQGSSAVMLMHVDPPTFLSAFSSASILPLLTLCQQSTSNGEQPTLYTSNSNLEFTGKPKTAESPRGDTNQLGILHTFLFTSHWPQNSESHITTQFGGSVLATPEDLQLLSVATHAVQMDNISW